MGVDPTPTPTPASRKKTRARHNVALDVYDWLHCFGLALISREQWAGKFARGAEHAASARRWERLKKKWDTLGVPFERIADPDATNVSQTRLCLRLLPGVRAWLNENLRPLPDPPLPDP